MTKLLVLIPAYNEEEFVEKDLRHYVDQSSTFNDPKISDRKSCP